VTPGGTTKISRVERSGVLPDNGIVVAPVSVRAPIQNIASRIAMSRTTLFSSPVGRPKNEASLSYAILEPDDLGAGSTPTASMSGESVCRPRQ
jgi:hypothetical protein